MKRSLTLILSLVLLLSCFAGCGASNAPAPTEAPKAEAPKTEAPKEEAPVAEEPATEETPAEVPEVEIVVESNEPVAEESDFEA